jgi:choline dehydrogenase-like flavoprotein/predicted dehydrogenase
MKVFDLCHLEDCSPIETDLCIVGTGPAGLSIANEFKGTNVRVLLLESGGLDEEPDTQALNEIQSVGAPGVSRFRLYEGLGARGRNRILGGSSHTWAGRCAPFSPIDFEKRPWISYSGWPLNPAELEPYLRKAGKILGLGPDCYDDRLWEYFKVRQPIPSLDSELLEPMFWQFSKSTQDRQPLRFGRDFVDSKPDNIQILLHANVLHVNTSSAGDSFESVDIGSLSGKRAEVKGKAIVLCCGGIENARLLLASNRLLPQGIGNQNDLVGRFLMDHTECEIANLNPSDADLILSRFGFYYLGDHHGRHLFLHGLALSRAMQQKEGLLNCHAFVKRIEVASLKRLVKQLVKQLVLGFWSGKGFNRQDAQTVAAHAAEILSGISQYALKNRPPLGRATSSTLAVMLEHPPDPESRILLSEDKKDALGIPISKVIWKISDLERLTARRMSQLLCREFERLRLPIPQIPAWLNEQREFVPHCFDKAHPTGTTRMSHVPAQGVVDINCQVHGVRGLFISGSSVFPTSGVANPTLMIVAMALRLSAWLKTDYFRSSEQIKDVVLKEDLSHRYARMVQTRELPDVVKVGFVGAGQRISQMYVPVLRQLQDFQIVGFTTRSSESAIRFESKTGIRSFSNVRELVDYAKPAFLIIAVPGFKNEETIRSILDLKVPILTETPASFSTSGVRAIVQKAIASNVIVAVAEQTPFLPLEQFKKRLIDLGVFGEIYAACNDFEIWGYHGVAQLRRYLKGEPKYVRHVEHSFNEFYGSNSIQQREIRWQSGSVVYNNGAVLLHNYGAKRYQTSTAAHLHGRRGAMMGYEIKLFNEKTGRIETAVAVREQPVAGYLKGISAALTGFGEVAWLNPFSEHPFSDEQIAVATILKSMSTAIREGSRPIYTADDNLEDMQIMQAFRYSSNRNGATIRLPFNEKIQKGLYLLDINFWKNWTHRGGLA